MHASSVAVQDLARVGRPAPSAVGAGLQRHTLVWLQPGAWQELLDDPMRDAEARSCLAHWAARDLPLVVTLQPRGGESRWHLGLAAPLSASRRRLAVSVASEALTRKGTFPSPEAVEVSVRSTESAQRREGHSGSQRAAWTSLGQALALAGVRALVYGSHGWQALTGLAYVRPDSDVDLLLQVDHPARADAAVMLLEQATTTIGPRLDGELMFPGGAAVAWREWAAWRQRGQGSVLVKRLRAVSLESRVEAFT